MARTYQVSILTPQGEVFKGTAESLSAQGQMGGFGVLAGHAPIIYALDKGVLKVTAEGKERFFTHATGILEVKPDHDVLVLVDDAAAADSAEDAKAKLAAGAKTS